MYPSVIAKQPRSDIMTYQTDCTLPDSLLEQIAEQGLSILPELVRIVINTAMQAEREAYLGAAAYERTDKSPWARQRLQGQDSDHAGGGGDVRRAAGARGRLLPRGLRARLAHGASAADDAGGDVRPGGLDAQGGGHHRAAVWYGHLFGSG